MRLVAMLAGILVAVPVFPSAAEATKSIPATIDPTARTDVTANLQRFVGSLPDGETVVFPRHAKYRIDGTLEWHNRKRITIEGNRASLIAGVHGGPNRATVRLVDCSGWTIRDLTIKGADPTGRFASNYQWQHGYDLRGVEDVTLARVTVSGVFGDAIYVGMSTTSYRWSQDVSIVNSTAIRSGRMSISITAGQRVTVRGGVWSKPAFTTFDIEPNTFRGGADGVLIENTTIGPEGRFAGTLLRFGRGLVSTGSALAIIGRGSVSNVTLRDNRLTGRALHVVAEQPANLRPKNIVVQGNTSTSIYTGPPPAAMYFRNVDGLTVTGNKQPIQPSGNLAMVATRGATRVEVSGQYPYRNLTPIGSRVPYLIGGLCVLLLVLGVFRGLVKRRVTRRARPAA